jgi:hypothetical protein
LSGGWVSNCSDTGGDGIAADFAAADDAADAVAADDTAGAFATDAAIADDADVAADGAISTHQAPL